MSDTYVLLIPVTNVKDVNEKDKGSMGKRKHSCGGGENITRIPLVVSERASECRCRCVVRTDKRDFLNFLKKFLYR